MKQIDNPFWQYSVQRYTNPGVTDICLYFQNEYRANINLLLLADWLGEQHIIIPSQDWQTLDAHIQHWHKSIVIPLRCVRQELKNLSNNQSVLLLRENISAQELLAEQIEQAILYEYVVEKKYHPSVDDTNTCKRGNIMKYLQLCGLTDESPDQWKEKIDIFLTHP